MARHFTVTLISPINNGPYNIYYDRVGDSNFTVLFGTTTIAENLTVSQVQNGILVTVPDDATKIILFSTDSTICYTT